MDQLFGTAKRCALAALCIVGMWGCRAPGASAQDAIVVTATRLPTPESEVASSITVITGDEIEQKQERTLPDVLEAVPGLNVVQTGGPGGTTQVFMRGTNANHVKVFIDGIEANDPSTIDGSFDFGHVLTSDIDRVEVLRGPQSGLYGADAIGGVINIITKAGSGPPRFTGSLDGGSFGTFDQSAGARGSVSRFNYAFDIAHFHSGDTQVTPTDLVPPGTPVNPDSYDNRTISTKLGATLTDNVDIGLVARTVDTALHLTSDDFTLPATVPEVLRSEQDSSQRFLRGTGHIVLFDGRLDQTIGVAYTYYRNRFLDPNPDIATLGDDPSNFHGDRIKFDWQGNIKLSAGEVATLGAEHQLDRINADTPVAAETTNNAGYAQLQSSFGERFFNTLSLRYDGNAQFGGKATYRVAPAYLVPATGTKLKASVGTGFNPPSLVELYENFLAFAFFANPGLRPETSIGYDAGFEQTALKDRVQFGATYFHNDIKNLIASNSTGTSYTNIGQATTYGVESFVAYRPSNSLTMHADYTYTLAQDDIQHIELMHRARNKASLDASWRISAAASLTGSMLYVGPRFDTNRDGTVSNLPVNGYMVLNLAGSYDLGHGITGFARVDNMLDRHYQDPLGFQRPGIGVFAGVRVAFDTAMNGEDK